VRFDAGFELMMDRAQRQVAFEFFEGLFDFGIAMSGHALGEAMTGRRSKIGCVQHRETFLNRNNRSPW